MREPEISFPIDLNALVSGYVGPRSAMDDGDLSIFSKNPRDSRIHATILSFARCASRPIISVPGVPAPPLHLAGAASLFLIPLFTTGR